jgi:hypothetical protein
VFCLLYVHAGRGSLSCLLTVHWKVFVEKKEEENQKRMKNDVAEKGRKNKEERT